MQWYCKVSPDRKHLYETDNVNELWEKLKAEVKISYPIETFDYGMREVAFFDPNGYMIQLGQGV